MKSTGVLANNLITIRQRIQAGTLKAFNHKRVLNWCRKISLDPTATTNVKQEAAHLRREVLGLSANQILSPVDSVMLLLAKADGRTAKLRQMLREVPKTATETPTPPPPPTAKPVNLPFFEQPDAVFVSPDGKAALATNVGPKRANNEDAGHYEEVAGKRVMALADGMGGHGHGEAASRIAISTFFEAIRQGGQSILSTMLSVHNRIKAEVPASPGRAPGTTFVAAIVDEAKNILQVVQIGDSRTKAVTEDGGIGLSKDHGLRWATYAKQARPPFADSFIDDIDVKPIVQDPIISALGLTMGEKADPRIPDKIRHIAVRLKPSAENTKLLLYTDGARGGVTEAEITSIVRREESLGANVEGLIARAYQTTTDNVTVGALLLEGLELDYNTMVEYRTSDEDKGTMIKLVQGQPCGTIDLRALFPGSEITAFSQNKFFYDGGHFALYTHKGGPRTKYPKTNEDSLGYAKVKTPNGAEFEVYVVSDGVGGHGHGEAASRIVVESFISAIKEDVTVLEATLAAQSEVRKKLSGTPGDPGATLAAAVVDKQNNKLYTVQVGDARVKMIDSQREAFLSVDHGLAIGNFFPGLRPGLSDRQWEDILRQTAQKISAMGLEPNSPTANALGSNVIISCIGGPALRKDDAPPPSKIRILEIPLVSNGAKTNIVLSSDGVNDGVSEEAVTTSARSKNTPADIAKDIVEQALPTSGDNISVVTIDLPYALDLAKMIEYASAAQDPWTLEIYAGGSLTAKTISLKPQEAAPAPTPAPAQPQQVIIPAPRQENARAVSFEEILASALNITVPAFNSLALTYLFKLLTDRRITDQNMQFHLLGILKAKLADSNQRREILALRGKLFKAGATKRGLKIFWGWWIPQEVTRISQGTLAPDVARQSARFLTQNFSWELSSLAVEEPGQAVATIRDLAKK